MSIIRNIFIIHQEGMDALVPYVVEALNDVMNCFPQYKQYFPITNLGNWKSKHAYLIQDGTRYLAPYESMDWYLARAKQRALSEDRWHARRQINAEQMLIDLNHDPYRHQIPQWSINLTTHDLYGGEASNFCLGVTQPDAFSIISTSRFIKQNNQLDMENFLTTVQHEFSHILGVTEGNRPNVYECLGTHCSTAGCIMQQRLDGRFNDITEIRLRRKATGFPPLCSHCIQQGNKNLSILYRSHHTSGPTIPGNPHNGGRN